MPMPPILQTVQAGFRGRPDLDAENVEVSGWFAAVNTNWVASALDTSFRVRFLLVYQTTPSPVDREYTLYYSHNEGSFTQVTTTSSVIQAVASVVSGYDDDDDASQLIGAGDFITPNSLINSNSNITGVVTIPGDSTDHEVETEWVLQLVSSDLNRGDTIELRIRNNVGVPINGGYTYAPIISTQRPRLSIQGKELRIRGKELAIRR